jgi:hypothetical protein
VLLQWASGKCGIDALMSNAENARVARAKKSATLPAPLDGNRAFSRLCDDKAVGKGVDCDTVGLAVDPSSMGVILAKGKIRRMSRGAQQQNQRQECESAHGPNENKLSDR